MGDSTIAFNDAAIAFSYSTSHEPLGVYMDEKNKSVLISVPPGTNMERFAPVAVEIAKFYNYMTVFMDAIPGVQLQVKSTDDAETFLNRFAALSFLKSPKPKNPGSSF